MTVKSIGSLRMGCTEGRRKIVERDGECEPHTYTSMIEAITRKLIFDFCHRCQKGKEHCHCHPIDTLIDTINSLARRRTCGNQRKGLSMGEEGQSVLSFFYIWAHKELKGQTCTSNASFL